MTEAHDPTTKQALSELVTAILNDSRIDDSLEDSARVSIMMEHTIRIAASHGLEPAALAAGLRHVAEQVEKGPIEGPVDIAALSEAGMIQHGNPLDPGTAERMGYPNMVMAITAIRDGSRIEIGVARIGTREKPWAVLEHINCNPADPAAGCSIREDYASLAEAVAEYVAAYKGQEAGASPSM